MTAPPVTRYHPLEAIYQHPKRSEHPMTPNDHPEPTDMCGGRRIPTVFAQRVRGRTGDTLRFTCRFCGKEHIHGAGAEPGDGDGHRVAHCFTEDSPYAETGYYLVEVETATAPRKTFRAKYLRDGRIVSGFLLRQRREIDSRGAR